MKKTLIAIVLLFCISCSSTRNINNEENSDPIRIATTDFIKNSKLRKNSNIFSLEVLIDNDSILGIRISPSPYKISITEVVKIDSYSDYFPTDYEERAGKLFYWNDSSRVVTSEILDVLERYNHIDYSNNTIFVIDEKKKGAHYYFCKSDLSKFKRVETSVAMGWYKPPRLKCIK